MGLRIYSTNCGFGIISHSIADLFARATAPSEILEPEESLSNNF